MNTGVHIFSSRVACALDPYPSISILMPYTRIIREMSAVRNIKSTLIFFYVYTLHCFWAAYESYVRRYGHGYIYVHIDGYGYIGYGYIGYGYIGYGYIGVAR